MRKDSSRKIYKTQKQENKDVKNIIFGINASPAETTLDQNKKTRYMTT